ncbi:MAG TPA: FliH/SctL family protein [Steroidobacter sp.]
MDAVIRSAHIQSSRTRLSDARLARAGGGPDAQPTVQQSIRAKADALRLEIETQVRAELSTQMKKLYQEERERAFAEGHADALEAARVEAAAELARTQEELRLKVAGALSAMESAHAAALSKLESSVGEVAFAAVCRFVNAHGTSSSFVQSLVQQTCAELRGDMTATARMHPRDLATLSELLQDGEMQVQSLALKFVADESLALGGCVIEAASGHYDGGLESQLRRLHVVLMGAGS